MKKYLAGLFNSAAEKLAYLNEINITFNAPTLLEHGDLATNAAMILTKSLKRNPRSIAEEIIANLNIDKDAIEKVEVAGPGFINFYFTMKFKGSIIREIIGEGDNYGKSDKYKGKKAMVEFVSANPTGPLTVGHGRNAVYGDTVANMLEWAGYQVDREYYFNNAGRQMRTLGDSVRLRYLEVLGEKIEFPEDYYQGQYIKDIALQLFKECGPTLKDEPAEGKFKSRAESEIFEDIKRTLGRLDIKFNNFFNENTLYEDGKINDVLKVFKDKNLSYEKEGAVWLKLSELGNEQDKVIVKSTGEPTYRLPDIAYHMTKFNRGYDLMVDIFGSDHNATYPDVMAALKSLGYDVEKIKVLIHQFVTVIIAGEIVKMSTRKANYITLDELIDEAGADASRYFFNMRGIQTHLNFDLDLAKKQSDENPVFYLQYAHARICSIMRMTVDEKLNPSYDNLELLSTNEEKELIKKLHSFKDELLASAEAFESSRIAAYLVDLAAAFHKFYTQCRIIGVERKLGEARLALCIATKTALKNGMAVLGVTAPEKM